MLNPSPKTATILLCTLLSACGGGGDTSSSPASTLSTSGGTSNGTIAGTAATSVSSDPASPSPTAFAAQITAAPSDGATLNGIVHFEIHGTGIESAELLPPTGSSPVLGTFTVSADKTVATLDFDTTTLPNGTLQLRASAFNQPAGTASASEIVAMPTRKWTLGNTPPYQMNPPPPDPTSIPDASYMPEVLIALSRLPYVDPQALTALQNMDDATFTDLVTNRWSQFESTIRRYVPVNVVFDYPTPLGFSGPWPVCMNDHGVAACREVVGYLRATMAGKQPAQPT
jgi:hypothetical protein